MELYSLANILLYTAIGLLFVNILLKFYFVRRFCRKNESNVLTDDQKKRIKKFSLPVTCVAAVLGFTALVIAIILITAH